MNTSHSVLKGPRNAFGVPLACLLLFNGCAEERADAYGNFESQPVTVASEATGRLQRFDVREGDVVTAGQPVALVDTTQLSLQAREQSLLLEAARIRADEAAAQLRALQAQLATAEVDYERARRLYDQNASTSSDLNRLSGAVAALTEQAAAAGARVRLARQEHRIGEARLAHLRDRIDRSTILNPVEGTILTTMVEPGEFVQPGRPLYSIAPLDSLVLRAYVSGNQLASIRIGSEVAVLYDAGDGSLAERAGRLTWIASEAEFTPTPIQTRDERVDLVYAVKIIVPNPTGDLKIGMPAEVRLSPAAESES